MVLLALPAPSCDGDKETVVVCGVDLRRRRLEPGGRAFHAVHEKPVIEAKQRGKAKPAEKEASDDEADTADASWRKKRKEGGDKRGALKLGPLLVGEDLYKLLEVSESASTEQIKKQYRKLALQHHPDKHGGPDPSDAPEEKAAGGLSEKDLMFVKIQEAYEVLSDQAKRRQYDSSLDFDDDIPEEVDESVGFYETFGPVFRRNGRWSTRLPVPGIGDDKTDISRVHKFYDFWLSFESWRDFSMHDEYNLEEAEYREERRWMERQNQKIRKKYQDTERRRVLRLTETAERLDPRIRAEREEKEAKKREEKERRARAKQEEEDAKRRAEEERKRKEELEQAEREEKERAEREQRKQSKQAAKAMRQRLRKNVQSMCSLDNAEMEELQELCLATEVMDPIEALCDRLEAIKFKSEATDLVRSEMAEWKRRRAAEVEEQARQRQEARRREEQKASEAKDTAAVSGTPWSTEELGLLAKGLQKFPGGTGGRWALITQLLNASGHARTEREVVEKTKELSEGQSLRSMGSRIAAENTFQAPKAKAAAAKSATAKAPAAPAASTPASPADAGAAGAEAKAEAPEAKAPAAKAEAEVEWTPEQQKALEMALQKHPATLDKNERWRLIAEEVPGKSKAQCVERFKFLREQLLKQKKP